MFDIPIISSLIFLARYFSDKRAFKVQKKLITSPRPIIFDVGAHIGQTAKTYRHFFPKASVYSFEPFPQSFQKFSQKHHRDRHIFGQNLAVSEQSGQVTFHANHDSATNSVLAIAPEGQVCWGKRLQSKEQLTVPAVSLDDFCREQNIQYIDILKLDLQGHELAALKGAEELLSRQAIDLIYFEFLVSKSYEEQPKLLDYIKLLEQHQYQLLDFYSPIRKGVQLLQCDLIFVSPKLNLRIQKSIKKGGFSTG